MSKQEQATQEKRLYHYARGYEMGTRESNPGEYSRADPDFMAGYKKGQKDRSIALSEAATILGLEENLS